MLGIAGQGTRAECQSYKALPSHGRAPRPRKTATLGRKAQGTAGRSSRIRAAVADSVTSARCPAKPWKHTDCQKQAGNTQMPRGPATAPQPRTKRAPDRLGQPAKEPHRPPREAARQSLGANGTEAWRRNPPAADHTAGRGPKTPADRAPKRHNAVGNHSLPAAARWQASFSAFLVPNCERLGSARRQTFLRCVPWSAKREAWRS